MENLSIPESDMLSTRVNFSNSIVNDEIIQNLTNFLVPVAFGIILTVGLVGNLLVITVVRKLINKGSCWWESYYLQCSYHKIRYAWPSWTVDVPLSDFVYLYHWSWRQRGLSRGLESKLPILSNSVAWNCENSLKFLGGQVSSSRMYKQGEQWPPSAYKLF